MSCFLALSLRNWVFVGLIGLLSHSAFAAAHAQPLQEGDDLPKVEVLSCGNQCAKFVPAKKTERRIEFPRSISGPFNPHAEGMVLLTYIIGEDGNVRDISPIYVLGPPAFADRTIETVKSWTYEPATLNGKPVPQVTLFRFTYDATSLVAGANLDIADALKSLATSPTGQKLDEDISKLREGFRDPMIGRYQRAILALPLAQHAIKQGDFLEARRLAMLGTAVKSGASQGMVRSLWLIRIAADLFLGEIGDALFSRAQIGDVKDIAPALTILENLDQTRAKLDAMPQFAVQAKIPEGPESTVYWHILYRRTFGFRVMSGNLEKFVLGCRGGMVESKITETAQWQVPKSWSDCAMHVYGTPGTRLNLIEAN